MYYPPQLPQEYMLQGQLPQGQFQHEPFPQEYMLQGQFQHEYMPHEPFLQEYMLQGQFQHEYIPHEPFPQEYTPHPLDHPTPHESFIHPFHPSSFSFELPHTEEWNPVFLPLPDEPNYPIVPYSPPKKPSDSPNWTPTVTKNTEPNIHENISPRPLALIYSSEPTPRSTPRIIPNYPPSDEPVSGTILTNTSGITPDGYLPCDGSSCLRSTYPTLFSAIGTTYSDEDDSTTFTVPDLEDPDGAGIFYIIKI